VQLHILYRGPLESCNYGCVYCPFAKKVDTRAELLADRRALERFTAWVGGRTGDRIGVLITPWGEGLVRRHYREALVALSNMPNVERAAIQTNLSSSLGWVERADKASLALWATYHPEWVSRSRFVERVRALFSAGVRMSCGAVGFTRLLDDIEALRAELPEEIYLWVNAVKDGKESYTAEQLRRFERIDPLFRVSTRHHPSLGRSCRAGASVISVDGEGTMRRCHFIREPIGNIYEPGFEAALVERPCTNLTCGCHIGYVHLDELDLYRVFGANILERIPAPLIWPRRTTNVALDSPS
jgi:MoaA/NifB/PqqE/SkfB family radical SAM enzyme